MFNIICIFSTICLTQVMALEQYRGGNNWGKGKKPNRSIATDSTSTYEAFLWPTRSSIRGYQSEQEKGTKSQDKTIGFLKIKQPKLISFEGNTDQKTGMTSKYLPPTSEIQSESSRIENNSNSTIQNDLIGGLPKSSMSFNSCLGGPNSSNVSYNGNGFNQMPMERPSIPSICMPSKPKLSMSIQPSPPKILSETDFRTSCNKTPYIIPPSYSSSIDTSSIIPNENNIDIQYGCTSMSSSSSLPNADNRNALYGCDPMGYQLIDSGINEKSSIELPFCNDPQLLDAQNDDGLYNYEIAGVPPITECGCIFRQPKLRGQGREEEQEINREPTCHDDVFDIQPQPPNYVPVCPQLSSITTLP